MKLMHHNEPRLVLAPLRGITGTHFRTIFSGHFDGFDRAVAPFITTTRGSTAGWSHFRDILPEHNTRLPVVPQLIGKCGEDFVRMARQVHELGYEEINWNLGCPHPVVTRKGRGSGLLPHPERIREFLEKVVGHMPCRLSLKIRSGLENPDELWSVLKVINDYPLSELIIHPRTGKQQYGGTCDLDRYGEALAMCRHPVIYNGDITTPEGFTALHERFPATAAWMIGRGTIHDPFLPMLIRGASMPPEPTKRILAFHDELYERYRAIYSGPGPLLGAMKELWSYLSGGFEEGARLLKKIRKATSYGAYERAVRTHGAWIGPR
jgi:tRNA-dihydrouridine synthase